MRIHAARDADCEVWWRERPYQNVREHRQRRTCKSMPRCLSLFWTYWLKRFVHCLDIDWRYQQLSDGLFQCLKKRFQNKNEAPAFSCLKSKYLLPNIENCYCGKNIFQGAKWICWTYLIRCKLLLRWKKSLMPSKLALLSPLKPSVHGLTAKLKPEPSTTAMFKPERRSVLRQNHGPVKDYECFQWKIQTLEI